MALGFKNFYNKWAQNLDLILNFSVWLWKVLEVLVGRFGGLLLTSVSLNLGEKMQLKVK